MPHRILGLLAVVALAVVVPTAPAGAADGSLSSWELEERAGSTTLDDHTGGRDGTIGSSVELTGASVHRWSTVAPDDSPYDPGRIHTVADHPELDFDSDRAAVLVRLRTTAPKGNIVQKGQSRTSGGFFKIEMDDGRVACMVKGSGGSAFVRSEARIDDGSWHDVHCERDGAGVTLRVDGAVADRRTRSTGDVDNSKPLAIGGKNSCNQTSVGCDYFSGELDRVVLATGAQAVSLEPTTIAK